MKKALLLLLLFAAAFAAPSITTSTLPEGKVGSLYSATVQGSCEKPCFFIVSGLPYGLVYYQPGPVPNSLVITGVPQYGYEGEVKVKLVENLSVDRAEKSLTLVIVPPLFADSPPPSVIIPGQEYKYQLMATGGRGSYSWDVVSCNLPSGITLDSSGLVSGIASDSNPVGTYPCLFEVTDSDGDSAHFYTTFYVSYPKGHFKEASGLQEILTSWQVLSILILMLTGALIAVAIMLGKAFSIPTLASWGNVEITQFFVTVFIVIGMIGILTTLDAIVVSLLAGTPYKIDEGGNATLSIQKYGHNYIDKLINNTNKFASLAFESNFESAKKAYKRETIYCTNLINAIPCFQFSASYAKDAYRELDIEYYSYVVGEFSNILTSLLAQKYFLDFAIEIGPLLLFMGIVMRSFFATRSLGGTLMALGLGLFYIYPLMYIVDMATLSMTFYGPDSIASTSSCPAPCSTPLPVAVRVTGNYNVSIFGSAKLEEALGPSASSNLTRGVLQWLDVGSSRYYSCKNLSFSGKVLCPDQCRYLPYPIKDDSCMAPEVQEACYGLREECKVNLLDMTYASTGQCPISCKVHAPMKNDCSECIYEKGSYSKVLPSYCRYAYKNGTSVVPACDTDYKSQCSFNFNNPFKSCMYIFPMPNTDCNKACSTCPEWYRITGLEEKPLSGSITQQIKESCVSCPDECRVSPNGETLSSDLCNIPSCNECPEQCRIRANEGWLDEDECDSDACKQCPLECKSFKPPDEPCSGCLVADEREIYYPPIQLECPSLCSGSSKETEAKVESFLARGEEGTYGKPELKTLGNLMIMAFLLPLFNVFITLLFVKALSEFFGGDIELPGLQKVL
ncbi:MAG: Ig domain-containing protein [Candidatus Anstonellales archaeon]